MLFWEYIYVPIPIYTKRMLFIYLPSDFGNVMSIPIYSYSINLSIQSGSKFLSLKSCV